ncbi:FERM, ARHGEF and pleckstrin domain-containing protein 2 isoform X11 [Chelonia mydas]|uniref:FERM, ARHGEF and pleckstrin domain-containing protein 2 isoform X11 n=1 Tax=Chelonia mydas TaxID=8469 RepID=UPI00042BB41C|nr:FERM, ARHGEF and pleckstrin domain-containing protein 2 isoform X11 [Chelonia mydas]XP_043378380.1 FERM, ARHGEF and pleckstrin domain-containing protein 2 isoform X11 [Chelonia mydas]XP_043378381.1 FERM, ARHGEF and pleckstrin domain-containing protein 2 isoform X11 [Chelonia mydas]XP_043378382.1 FERM, ARHGEF and pleckstrin domain-containing protein 2 isoform X11 [Chelonia mydas]
MGEIEGTYRILQTPGSRLGVQKNTGVSTLEPEQNLSTAMAMTPAKMPERDLPIKIKLLDNTVEVLDVESKCYGQTLLTEVYKHLNLVESDYFGIEFQNIQSYWIWLEPMKPVIKQVRRPKNTMLHLAVKFFPPDPGQLQEEYTRYLFALQIKRDLAEERLTCSDNTAALIISHLLQSEIGDFDESVDRDHLKTNQYLPNQERLQGKILEFHRKHLGQTPAESDFQVLEIARKLEMYGIRFHLASDREGSKINLAVSHMGILVFQGTTKINTFNWSKVRKLSFKRKRFLIKLHPEVHGPYQDTLEFLFGSRDECKNFWKICVEYHTFFRLFDQPKPKAKAVFFSRGSSFRYSGRTQKQLVDYVKDSGMKKTPYERRHSKARVFARTSNTDVPKQSVSFTEGLGAPESDASVSASFHSVYTSFTTTTDLPICTETNRSFLDPRAPYTRSPTTEKSIATPSEETGKKATQQPGSPILQSFQGLSMDHPQLSSFTLKSPQSLNPTFQVNLNPAGQGSSPLLSPVLSDAGSARVEEEEEVKRKQCPTDKVYFIAKEILATERTYVKDLEVITVWFRSAVIKENAMPEGLMTLLFSNIDPIYEFHRSFLKEMEQRLALWEGRSNAYVKGDCQRIGDVMLRNMCMLKEFTSYLQKHDEVLTELEKATKRLKKLEMVYKEFELQKVCYLPLNTFLLKPIQRLIHYKLILGRLCKHYTVEHQDYADCRNALKEVTEMTTQLQNSLIHLENFQKLTELQHDLIGIDNLIAPDREFIREGCLYKLTKKGLQQRMFFLFSDMLLYTSKGVTGTNQFKIHGYLPLHGMLVEESENEWSVPHCFTIYSAQKTIVVAASTRQEMGKWMEDLNMAIEMAKKSSEKYDTFLESSMYNRSNRSSDEVSLEQESEDDIQSSRSSLDRQSHHRANTTMHVCWYRNTSVSMTDHTVAVENQLSGYLLRKFKNSNGWQKLWVVFTNFCLFFYKTHQDDYPLASLPLLGYTVSTPVEADGIQKDYVFKLQFKSHVYFFRAESKYTFERWMEVIKRATDSPGRSSLLIPMDEKDIHTN